MPQKGGGCALFTRAMSLADVSNAAQSTITAIQAQQKWLADRVKSVAHQEAAVHSADHADHGVVEFKQMLAMKQEVADLRALV